MPDVCERSGALVFQCACVYPRPRVDSLQDAKIQEPCEKIHLNVSDPRQSSDEDPVLLGKMDKKTALTLLREVCTVSLV